STSNAAGIADELNASQTETPADGEQTTDDADAPADDHEPAAEDAAANDDAQPAENGENSETPAADSENPEENTENAESNPENPDSEEAADAKEPEPVDPGAPTPVKLKNGGYFSIAKILSLLFLYLLWVKSTDWLSADAVRFKKDWRKWNAIVVGAFVGTFAVALLLPWFWAGITLVALGYLVPFVLYVRYRNEDMNPADMVFTRDHLRHFFAEKVSKVGVKVDPKAKDKFTTGCAANLTSYTKIERQREMRRIQAHAHEGFMDARKMIAGLMENQPEATMLDFVANGVNVKHLLDGVWHPGEPLERETTDPALEALKILCGMNPQDRRSKQSGECEVEFTYRFDFPDERLAIRQMQERYDKLMEEDNDENYVERRKLKEELRRAKEDLPQPEMRTRKAIITVTSQGTQTGERVMLKYSSPKMNFHVLEDCGMRDKLAEKVQPMFDLPKGILIFSAPVGNGMKTTLNVALNKTDRFQREYAQLDKESNPHEVVENIPVTTYSEKDSIKDVMKRFFLKEPAVSVIQDMDGAILNECFKEMAMDDRLIVTTIRAQDASEALLRMLVLKDAEGNPVSRDKVADNVKVVVCQRLIRKLCNHCKQPVKAPPALAQALGFPAGREAILYQPPAKPAEGEEVCSECHGIGYKGRTAITEVLFVGPTVQEVLKKAPKLDLLRKAAAKDGNRTLREEGMVLVAKGITSVQELKRILDAQ
ncbi:MAG: hypothetical protein IKW80_00900, partial [Thermoguttaceae bacterium]|nr:hypothetical protein [Thermoguttaceae bacterium]